MTSELITNRTAKFHQQKRRRTVFLRRFCENVRRHPWALVVALLLILALGWAMALVEIPLPGGSSYPFLLALWNGAAKLAIILVASLLTLCTFAAPPKKALEYESGLAHVELIDRFGNPPALVSRVYTNKIERLTFYSAGISLERWIKRQGDIQDALNIMYVAPPQYAYRRRYYILLTVVSGVVAPRKENLYDDELS